MSQIVLFGPPTSSYVRTARLIAFEKGIDHVVEPLEIGGEAHRKLHPWAKVPVLRHGDLTLLETSAIARYFDETGPGPSLLPAAATARALMEQWISTINSYLYDSLIRQYALPHIVHKFRGGPLDPEKIAAAVPAMQRGVAHLDAAYTGRSWIAGEALSLADFFVAPIVQTLSMFSEGQGALAAAPSLSRAYAALEARDSFRKTHAGLFGR